MSIASKSKNGTGSRVSKLVVVLPTIEKHLKSTIDDFDIAHDHFWLSGVSSVSD